MEQNDVFRFAIAYESDGAAIHFKDLAERLAEDLGSSCDSWEFELLAMEKVRQSTAAIAAEADMIIIAASGEQDLPDGVKNWIECWLPQRIQGRGILVALLSQTWEAEDRPPSPGAYLRWIAWRAQMDFICNLAQWSEFDALHSDLCAGKRRQTALEEAAMLSS